MKHKDEGFSLCNLIQSNLCG